MKKILLSICMCLAIALTTSAQPPQVSIHDIQFVSPADLAACNDSSSYLGDTLKIEAVVLAPASATRYTNSGDRAQFWVQETGTGSWLGIDIFQPWDPNLNEAANLAAGDLVEITGIVETYQGETEFIPLEGVDIVTVGQESVPDPRVISVGELNDDVQINNLVTGEQWEGMYIEIQDVQVVSVDFFSGGTRVSFTVQDAAGNRVNISDKFMVQQMPNSSTPGTFSPPNPNDSYDYIRGVVVHSANGCAGGGRGYEIHPMSEEDYKIADACPSLQNLARNYVAPSSSQNVMVSVTASDADGIADAKLFYAVGISNNTYFEVPMTNTSGSIWEGEIPMQVDGSFVKYYVSVSDSNTCVSMLPNVPNGFDPEFYTVRDNGLTIYDVQFVPSSFTTTSSGYEGMEVTVSGVVTASAETGNLGYVYLQQEDKLDWAGIMVLGNTTLFDLEIDQLVEVTGVVEESFGFTRIGDISSVNIVGTGSIDPISKTPETFTSWDSDINEKYESMLIKLENPGSHIYVVAQSADGTSNFGEYRVGSDPFDPANGCRVLAGRQTGSAFSSLDVSYVNDSLWASTDGQMNVDPCIVMDGDTITSIVGPMLYSFSNFKITPRNNDDVVANKSCMVAVEQELNGGFVKVYPNPAQDYLRLDYSFAQNTVLHANVLSVMGVQVKSFDIPGNSGNRSLDISGLASGTYILNITDQNGKVNFHNKFVVIR